MNAAVCKASWTEPQTDLTIQRLPARAEAPCGVHPLHQQGSVPTQTGQYLSTGLANSCLGIQRLQAGVEAPRGVHPLRGRGGAARLVSGQRGARLLHRLRRVAAHQLPRLAHHPAVGASALSVQPSVFAVNK